MPCDCGSRLIRIFGTFKCLWNSRCQGIKCPGFGLFLISRAAVLDNKRLRSQRCIDQRNVAGRKSTALWLRRAEPASSKRSSAGNPKGTDDVPAEGLRRQPAAVRRTSTDSARGSACASAASAAVLCYQHRLPAPALRLRSIGRPQSPRETAAERCARSNEHRSVPGEGGAHPG